MDRFTERRLVMVERDLARRGIVDPKVVLAMSEVPRHLFVPPGLAEVAYADEAQPLPEAQTISQPYIVAFMAEALRLQSADKILEVGTGSGYSAAVLSELAREVFTLERHPRLATQAEALLKQLGYENVHVRNGDGMLGWPEEAPFDAIAVTAAGPKVPPALYAQLAPHGRLVMPLGTADRQVLVRIKRGSWGPIQEDLLEVRFAPLISGLAAQQ